MEDDMNIDIHENDCIVVETKGDEVGKRSPRWVGSPDPADAGASAPSSEVVNRAVDEGEEAEGEGKWQSEH
jgi:hypothetical protein